MSSQKIKVIVTRRLPSVVELRLKELFDTTLNESDTPMSQGELADAVAEADVLVPTVTDTIDARLLAQAGSQLRHIAQFGAGVDNLDIESAVQRGITVTNTPSVFTEDTADLAMALIIGVPRRMREGVSLVRSGEWSGWAPTAMLGRKLAGKTLGIVGMGRIGQAVAQGRGHQVAAVRVAPQGDADIDRLRDGPVVPEHRLVAFGGEVQDLRKVRFGYPAQQVRSLDNPFSCFCCHFRTHPPG